MPAGPVPRRSTAEERGKPSSTRAYFDSVAGIAGAAWDVSATEDLRMPHVEGQRPRGLKAKHWLGERVTEATRRDADVHRQFLDVVDLRAAPTSLLTPAPSPARSPPAGGPCRPDRSRTRRRQPGGGDAPAGEQLGHLVTEIDLPRRARGGAVADR